MHCTNCGDYVAQEQRYCARCGAPAPDPDLTRAAPERSLPDRRPAPADTRIQNEQTVFTVRPTLLFVKLGYACAVLGAIALVILLAVLERFTGIALPWFVYLPLALLLLVIPAYYHLKRNSIKYVLTDSKVEIDEGWLSRRTRNIPLRNIQDVTVSMGLSQRVLGFGNLVIDNASEKGGTTVLRNIHDPRGHADLLLRELRRWQ